MKNDGCERVSANGRGIAPVPGACGATESTVAGSEGVAPDGRRSGAAASARRSAVARTAFAIWVLFAAAGAAQTTALGGAAGDDAAPLSSELTVYGKFAVVREIRRLNVPEGEGKVVLPDIPPSAEASSIRFKWPEDAKVETIEQNMEYDLVNPSALLRKHIGREVELTLRDGSKVSGDLLYFDDSAFILRPFGGKGVSLTARFDNVREVVFPKPPESLLLRPSLVCLIRADRAGETRPEVSYVSNNFSWRADYVAVLNADDTAMDLSSWVTLDNHSGTSYDARRVRLATEGSEHFYDLPRPTKVSHNQLKQVRLFPPVPAVAVEKFLCVRVTEAGEAESKPRPQIILRFRNTKESGLGFALPAGKVRVLKADAAGRLEFVGEDKLKDVPDGETAELRIGSAFDVVAERRCAAVRKITDKVTEYDEELAIRCRRPAAARVRVELAFSGKRSLISPPKDIPEESRDAATWRGFVTVPQGDAGIRLRFAVREIQTSQ